MNSLQNNSKAAIRNLFLVVACLVSGTGVLFGEERSDLSAETSPQTPPPMTLRPVDTGRSVTFQIGGSKGSRGGYYNGLAVKTNLLYDAVMTPNLSIEFGVGPQATVEIGGAYNGWEKKYTDGTLDPEAKRSVHYLGKAEFHYWFGERFDGHFAGIQAFYADYDVGRLEIPMIFEKEFYYDGTAFGASVLYGYNWRLAPRWSLEFTLGVGVMQMKYMKMPGLDQVGTPENPSPSFNKTYFGPTTAGIKLAFMIK
jgi:hypothetical protein